MLYTVLIDAEEFFGFRESSGFFLEGEAYEVDLRDGIRPSEFSRVLLEWEYEEFTSLFALT